jgi:hypothetical protein
LICYARFDKNMADLHEQTTTYNEELLEMAQERLEIFKQVIEWL